MVANGPRGKIYNGPISRFVYNAFFNTYTKFRAFITKCTIVTNFLLCRPTNCDILTFVVLHFLLAVLLLFSLSAFYKVQLLQKGTLR